MSTVPVIKSSKLTHVLHDCFHAAFSGYEGTWYWFLEHLTENEITVLYACQFHLHEKVTSVVVPCCPCGNHLSLLEEAGGVQLIVLGETVP